MHRLAGITIAAIIVATAPNAAARPVEPDVVVFDNGSGAVERATLIDRLSEGYLVRSAGETFIVPFDRVLSIEAGAPAEPPPLVVYDDDDPRPRNAGTGSIIAGWIMFGVGGVTALACLEAANVTDDESFTLLAGVSGVVAVSGLVLALSGHSKKAESHRAIREWEARHRESRVIIAPLISHDVLGLGLAATF